MNPRAPSIRLAARAIGVGLAALSLSGAACARDPALETSAMAKGVLERAGAGTNFVDASTAAYAAVRHGPSGLVCRLPGNGAFNMGQFPEGTGNPGAYCYITEAGVMTSLIAVKYLRPVTLDAVFLEGVQATGGRAQARPWQGKPSAADLEKPDGLPRFRIARMEGTIDGAPRYLRVAMSERGGWYIQQVVAGDLTQADAVEATAGRAWRDLLKLLATSPPPASAEKG